jgi:hypothetical protein
MRARYFTKAVVVCLAPSGVLRHLRLRCRRRRPVAYVAADGVGCLRHGTCLENLLWRAARTPARCGFSIARIPIKGSPPTSGGCPGLRSPCGTRPRREHELSGCFARGSSSRAGVRLAAGAAQAVPAAVAESRRPPPGGDRRLRGARFRGSVWGLCPRVRRAAGARRLGSGVGECGSAAVASARIAPPVGWA